MILLPIRTEMVARRTPVANYAIIAANCVAFLLLDFARIESLSRIKDEYLTLHADWPALYQFFTYQFLHADLMHLGGNMLFLWVFGQSVNAKLGNWVYFLFYLAGGVFAGTAFVLDSSHPLLGASGAIASITTAYLVLFPRSRVTVLFIMFFITSFEVPAMILIGVKVILWDNIISPGLSGPGNVAFTAHLGGYAFGFGVSAVLLLLRAIPRDQFDMLALLDRWNRRRAFRSTLSTPEARHRAEFGSVGRVASLSPAAQKLEDERLDRITDLRTRISERLERGEVSEAAALYEELMAVDPTQCLPARHQVAIARAFYAAGKPPQAAAAFERFLSAYRTGLESDEIRLLLGIICARDLGQYEAAEKHLSEALHRFTEGPRREQCQQWLEVVRRALGKTVAGG